MRPFLQGHALGTPAILTKKGFLIDSSQFPEHIPTSTERDQKRLQVRTIALK